MLSRYDCIYAALDGPIRSTTSATRPSRTCVRRIDSASIRARLVPLARPDDRDVRLGSVLDCVDQAALWESSRSPTRSTTRAARRRRGAERARLSRRGALVDSRSSYAPGIAVSETKSARRRARGRSDSRDGIIDISIERQGSVATPAAAARR